MLGRRLSLDYISSVRDAATRKAGYTAIVWTSENMRKNEDETRARTRKKDTYVFTEERRQ